MAIKLTYYTLVIPISTVLSKFPAGWEAWIKKNESDGCGALWYDANLFARASMDPRAVEKIQASWEKCGFKGKTELDGESRWEEFCLAETSDRCDWLSYCENALAAYLSVSAPGPVLGPMPRPLQDALLPEQQILTAVGMNLVLMMVAALGFIVLST